MRKQPTLPVARYNIIIMLRFWHPPLASAICEALLPGDISSGKPSPQPRQRWVKVANDPASP
ncbi:MAG: hypothetical protein HC898_01960 [Phycisphaerales bacterium]|nr:hypothetical protein [Phycisphaerales bacterium]